MADVTDYAAVVRVAEEVVRRFDRLDHVVFAVGAGSGKFGFPFWKLEPADWERVLKVNLIGAVNMRMRSPRVAGRVDRANAPIRRDRCCFSPRSPARSVRRPTSLQCGQGRGHQLRPVRRQGSGAIRSAGQHALPRHGPEPA